MSETLSYAEMVAEIAAEMGSYSGGDFETPAEHFIVTANPYLLGAVTPADPPWIKRKSGGLPDALPWLRHQPGGPELFLVDEAVAEHLSRAKADAWVFDGMSLLASVAVLRGVALPPSLRSFVADVLTGIVKRPPQGSRWKKHESPPWENYVAWWGVVTACERYGIPLRGSIEPGLRHGAYAVDVVRDAFEQLGQKHVTRDAVIKMINRYPRSWSK